MIIIVNNYNSVEPPTTPNHSATDVVDGYHHPTQNTRNTIAWPMHYKRLLKLKQKGNIVVISIINKNKYAAPLPF